MTFQYFVNNILTDYLREKLKEIASIWRALHKPSLGTKCSNPAKLWIATPLCYPSGARS